MKKLLSILAAVGLTATASTAVVACTTSTKVTGTTATHTFDKVKLAKDKTTADLVKLGAAAFTFTVKDGKTEVKTVKPTFEVADGSKKNTVKITVTIDFAAYQDSKKHTLKVEMKSSDDANKVLDKKFDDTMEVKVSAKKAEVNELALDKAVITGATNYDKLHSGQSTSSDDITANAKSAQSNIWDKLTSAQKDWLKGVGVTSKDDLNIWITTKDAATAYTSQDKKSVAANDADFGANCDNATFYTMEPGKKYTFVITNLTDAEKYQTTDKINVLVMHVTINA